MSQQNRFAPAIIAANATSTSVAASTTYPVAAGELAFAADTFQAYIAKGTAAADFLRIPTCDSNGRLYVKAGSGTGKGQVGGALFDHFADAGNSTTTETDLYSDTIPASTLAVNGDKLSAVYGGTFVNSATATRQLRVYFGGTSLFDSGALAVSAASSWVINVFIIRDSSSSVRCSVWVNLTGAATNAFDNYAAVSGLTLTNTQILKITGQAAGVGAATNDIVAKTASVLWRAAA